MRAFHAIVASCLVTACAAELFQVRIETGKDTHTNVIVRLDELQGAHRNMRSGIGASVKRKGTHCQAFSDPGGRDKIGEPFCSEVDAVFTDSDKPVQIGSILCSEDEDNLDGPASKAGWLADGDDDPDKTVRVQFRNGFNSFSQDSVPVGKVVKTGDTELGEEVTEAMVVFATGLDISKVSCQLFEDANGKEKLKGAFSTQDVTVGTKPKTVKSIKCEI